MHKHHVETQLQGRNCSRFTLLKTAVVMIPKPTMSAIDKLTMKHKTKVVEGNLLLANLKKISQISIGDRPLMGGGKLFCDDFRHKMHVPLICTTSLYFI